MKLRFTFSVIFVFTALSIAVVVSSADGITKTVKFVKGTHSATISGSVIRGDRDIYIAGAKSGQKMKVSITSLEKNAVFQIENPSHEFLENAGDSDDAITWKGTLPDNGNYKIIVGGTRGNATYKLTVAIQ